MAAVDNPLTDESLDEVQSPTSDESSEQQEPESDDPLEGREDLQKALYRLYIANCTENRFPRVIEVLDVQQAHLYFRNLQNIWRSEQDECWNLPNQEHGITGIPVDSEEMPRFDFVTNIYQAFGLSLIAAISQAPPRIRWFPDDAEKPEDIDKAEKFTKLSKIIERWNPVQI